MFTDCLNLKAASSTLAAANHPPQCLRRRQKVERAQDDWGVKYTTCATSVRFCDASIRVWIWEGSIPHLTIYRQDDTGCAIIFSQDTRCMVMCETALTVLVVAGALGLGYTQVSGGRADIQQTEKEQGKGRGKAKGKKSDKTSVADASVASTPPTVLQDAIPGQFDSIQPLQPSSPAPKSKKSKKKKTKAAAASSATTTNAGTPPGPTTVSSPTVEAYNSESSTSAVPTTRTPRTTKQSTTSIDTDGSWTRVEPRQRSYLAAAQTTTTTSDVATTTASSSPVAERMEEEEEEEDNDEDGAHSSFLLNSNTRDEESRRRTLAEKLLPKPRKTAVDDMLETPDHPTLSRVMRVQPRPDEKPVDGFSWGDYEDVREADADDEGWGVVKSKSE
ncbi:uncharacterized protein LACBIDRAFT_332132 [Laccaria bicolor S238N-H82]|uniref:Predicted protein n=1 Tax=Laccaria bicolor (strain S238N-H82 / ATCC MYA-4686) TaxID=486041 RepID=B0DRP6_LACBS|nr:uncharacterized protein LACBIDRAFT_332132 [Laccaria bicolor S238N-H82]EDR02904.1 predicted protein [Laccaria bicolor S238N-H82]|eukprot:XP_001886614.1 predicted protein [Laccaria bicolor S238N-H82]